MLEGESERRASILSALSLFSELSTFSKITQPQHSLLHGSILNLPKCTILNKIIPSNYTIDDALKLSETITTCSAQEENFSHEFLKYLIATYPNAKVAITTPSHIFSDVQNLLLYFEKLGISQVILNNKLIPLCDLLPSCIEKRPSLAFVIDRSTLSNRNYDRLYDALTLSAQITDDFNIPHHDICKGDLWLRSPEIPNSVTKVTPYNREPSILSNPPSTPSSLNEWLLYLQAINEPKNFKLIQILSWLKEFEFGTIPSNTAVDLLPRAIRILIEIYVGYLASSGTSFFLIDLPNNPLPNATDRAILELTKHLLQKNLGVLITNPTEQIKEVPHVLIRLPEPQQKTTPFTPLFKRPYVIEYKVVAHSPLPDATVQLDQSTYQINLGRVREIPYKLNQPDNFARPILESYQNQNTTSLTLKWSKDFVISNSSKIKLGNLLKITAYIRDSFVALPLARQQGISRKDFYSRKQDNSYCVKELYLKGYSYEAIMSAPLGEVSELFGNHPKLYNIFPLLAVHDLLHLSLKRPFMTLSSGEQHRINLLLIALNLKDNQIWVIENFDWELTEIEKKNLCKILNAKLPTTSTAIIRTSLYI